MHYIEGACGSLRYSRKSGCCRRN